MQGPLQHALVLQNLEEFMRQSWVDLIHPELLHHFEEQLWIFSEKLAWHSSRSTLLAYALIGTKRSKLGNIQNTRNHKDLKQKTKTESKT